jgi:6,7-dimethyl-8-ribityllumazine synthase
MKVIEGNFNAKGKRFGILVTRWNDFITSRLLEGAKDALLRNGAESELITIVYCPGAFEIPLIAQKMAKSGKYDAIIAVGTVIRGATPHFDFVAGEATKGLAKVALDFSIPCINAILTTDSIEQAIERAGTKAGNKGFEAAVVAIEMVSLCMEL